MITQTQFFVEEFVWLTNGDIVRHGDFSQPASLDRFTGQWYVTERPIFDVWGRQTRPVRALCFDNIRLF
jgi:hypothetical protein